MMKRADSGISQGNWVGRIVCMRTPVLLVIGVALCLAAFASQAGQPSIQMLPPQTNSNPFQGLSDIDPALARHQLHALNALRQKKLVEDTNKLLKLAQALNAQVQSGNRGTLTLAQLKEVKRIEKLARSVRQKMAQTYGGPTLAPIIMPTMP
jgi:hypothetical protein